MKKIIVLFYILNSSSAFAQSKFSNCQPLQVNKANGDQGLIVFKDIQSDGIMQGIGTLTPAIYQIYNLNNKNARWQMTPLTIVEAKEIERDSKKVYLGVQFQIPVGTDLMPGYTQPSKVEPSNLSVRLYTICEEGF